MFAASLALGIVNGSAVQQRGLRQLFLVPASFPVPYFVHPSQYGIVSDPNSVVPEAKSSVPSTPEEDGRA